MSQPSRTPRPQAPQAQPSYQASSSAVSAAVFVAETSIALGFGVERLSGVTALMLHGTVVALLAALLVNTARRGRDTGPLLLMVPAVAFTGPFAAFWGIFLGRLSRRGYEDVERLEAWYSRLSLSTELNPTARLADQVKTGRALDFKLGLAMPMRDLVQRGTISEKQAVLGLIARRFHPDYLPTLTQALLSEEPVIRVQAAAVAAKIRGDMPALVEGLLREASDPSAPIDAIMLHVAEARMCVQSGLMEAKDRERTERLIDGVMARTMLRVERSVKTSKPKAPSTSAVDALASHLLVARRFKDFRRLRRTQLWAQRGPWTYRALHPSARGRTT